VGYGKLVADRGFEVQRFRGSGFKVQGSRFRGQGSGVRAFAVLTDNGSRITVAG